MHRTFSKNGGPAAMEIITVQVQDKKRARILLDLLQSLDFVNSVQLQSAETSLEETAAQVEGPDHEAFGMWKDTSITAKSLRE
jgi:hypothetical protein